MDGVLTLGVDASWIGTNPSGFIYCDAKSSSRAALHSCRDAEKKKKEESIRLKAAVQKNKAFTFNNDQLWTSEPSQTGPGGGGSDVSVCSIQNNSLISLRLHQNQNQNPAAEVRITASRPGAALRKLRPSPGSVLLHSLLKSRTCDGS